MVISDVDYRRGFLHLQKKCRDLQKANEMLMGEVDRLTDEKEAIRKKNGALEEVIDELSEQVNIEEEREDLKERLRHAQLALQRVIQQNTNRGKILEAIKMVMDQEWVLDTSGKNAKLIFNYKKHLKH